MRWSVFLALLPAALLPACTIEMIPMSTSPREMVLPYLQKQCLETPAGRPDVTLIHAGSAPRRVLRLRPPEGMEASIQVLTPPFAQADYVLSTEWVDLGRSGQACHLFEVSGPKTAHIGDAVVGVVAVARSGATAYATDALDEKSFAVERDLFWLLDRADPILPAEQVGVGAVWTLKGEGMRAGELIEMEATYQLARMEGTRIGLEVTRTVHRPAQRIQNPLGKSHKVKELTLREVGSLDFDLRARPFANARFFDEKGVEILRVAVGYR